MPVEIPIDTFDPDSLDGYDNAPPGSYHVEVVKVDEEGQSKTSGTHQVVVDYEVLAGDPPGQEGKTHRDYFACTDKAFKRLLLFAVAVGLTTKDELKALKAAGQNPSLDFTKVEGRQLCIVIERDEYQGKVRGKVGFGMHAMNDPEAANIPKNQGKLNEVGVPSSAPDENPFS